MFKILFLFAQTIALELCMVNRMPDQHHTEKYYHATYFENQNLMQNRAAHQIEPVKDSYASVYFSHLNENFAYNTKGTCSYVALSMLLSFYDSYLNSYIVWGNMKAPTIANIDDETILRDFQSPGVTYAPLNDIKNLSNEAYISYVNNHYEDYLDMLLIERAYELYGTYSFESQNKPFGLGPAQQADLLDYYLWKDCHLGTNLIASYLPCGTQENVLINKIKEMIDRGLPVLVNAQFGKLGAHTVVAYDYDDDDIYVHFGWKDEYGDALSHVSIYDMGCTNIESISYFDLPEGAVPYVRQNYQKDLGNGHTKILDIETLESPNNVRLLKFDYSPYYIEWNSLMDDPFINQSGDRTVNVKIMNCDNDSVMYEKNVINQERMPLPSNISNQLIDTNGEYDFKVSLSHNIKNGDNFEKVFYLTNKNKHVADMSIINAPYYTSTTIYAEYTSVDGLEFQIKGKSFAKESNALALTSRKNNSRDSYVDLYFPRGVTEISFDMAFYSRNDYNYFYSNKGQIYIEEFKHGTYSKIYDFTENHEKISPVKSSYSRKTISFDSTTFIVRVHVKSQNITSINGTVQGRVLIKRLNVVSGRNNCLPCNGYEYDFNPMFGFNGTDFSSCNCYNYALDIEQHTDDYVNMQPGYLCDSDAYNIAKFVNHNYYSLDVLASLAYEDSLPGNVWCNGYVFREINAQDVAAPGCYKIALLIAASNSPSEDFHWLRQNSDGTWSHKLGCSRASDLDEFGNRIYHPETVELGNVGLGAIYKGIEGIKFFEISIIDL